jgi:hypothetical protein
MQREKLSEYPFMSFNALPKAYQNVAYNSVKAHNVVVALKNKSNNLNLLQGLVCTLLYMHMECIRE